MRPRSTRSPSFESTAGSTVSEPTIEIATTSTVPTPKDSNTREPIRNMPGHRGHDRQAGDEHRAAGRGRRDLQRVGGRAPARTLLALTAQVEQRVVDADSQADQQDHRVDRLVDVQQVAEAARSARAPPPPR